MFRILSKTETKEDDIRCGMGASETETSFVFCNGKEAAAAQANVDYKTV
jgi:hypothetical protein